MGLCFSNGKKIKENKRKVAELSVQPLVNYFIIYKTDMIFWPKGTIAHEVMNLPFLWWQLHRTPKLASERLKLKYGEHYRQYCLMFKPEKGFKADLPVIVYFHGGGWRYGSPENFEANAQPFLSKGHLVFLPSYRRRPRYDYYHMREDLDQILLTVAGKVKELGIKSPKYVFGGMSAGGNLAAHLVLNRSALNKANWATESIKGLFVCGSVLDLDQMPDHYVMDEFAGQRGEKKFLDANPINYIDEQTRLNIFCLHGSSDGMVPLASSASFIEKLQKFTQSKVKFIVHPEGTHLDAVQWAHQDDWQRKVLLDWLKSVVEGG